MTLKERVHLRLAYKGTKVKNATSCSCGYSSLSHCEKFSCGRVASCGSPANLSKIQCEKLLLRLLVAKYNARNCSCGYSSQNTMREIAPAVTRRKNNARNCSCGYSSQNAMREILWQHLHDPLHGGISLRPTSMWFSYLLAHAERAASANVL